MSLRWNEPTNDRRKGEDRREQPEPGRRQQPRQACGAGEDPRNPWSAHKREWIARRRAEREAA